MLLRTKVRTGWNEKDPVAHKLVPMLQKISNGKIAAIMVSRIIGLMTIVIH
jgi:hypothetical protein